MKLLLSREQVANLIVEGTTDKEQAKQLLTNDFTYQLTTPDGTMLFQKTKTNPSFYYNVHKRYLKGAVMRAALSLALRLALVPLVVFLKGEIAHVQV